MVYTFDSRIRFSEAGEDGKLSTQALINYLQDCSTFQTEDLGVGVDVLRQKHMAWMTAAWQIQVDRYPRYGEQVTIGTQALGYNAALAQRNFFMDDASGNRIVRANSYWTMVNFETGRAMRITGEMVDVFGTEEPIPMEYASRKIRLPQEEGEACPDRPVTEELLDVNHHVNNGKYIDLAARVVTNRLLGKEGTGEVLHSRQIRAEYKRAALPGDIMKPVLYKQDGGALVVFYSPEKEMFASVEFLF